MRYLLKIKQVAGNDRRVGIAVAIGSFPREEVVACYPDDIQKVVGVSIHSPLGVTFAAGVYASVFGSSSQPISRYARKRFSSSSRAHGVTASR